MHSMVAINLKEIKRLKYKRSETMDIIRSANTNSTFFIQNTCHRGGLEKIGIHATVGLNQQALGAKSVAILIV